MAEADFAKTSINAGSKGDATVLPVHTAHSSSSNGKSCVWPVLSASLGSAQSITAL
jgi:hypothetical protein